MPESAHSDIGELTVSPEKPAHERWCWSAARQGTGIREKHGRCAGAIWRASELASDGPDIRDGGVHHLAETSAKLESRKRCAEMWMRERRDAGPLFLIFVLLAAPTGGYPLSGGAAQKGPATPLLGRGYEAAARSRSRFAIFSIVALLHPVNDWIVFHDCLASSMAAILALRSVSSGLPL